MKFSLVNGKKTAPFSKGEGICAVCGNATQAKCGHTKIWHWAHCSKQMCDNWWENETAWHRAWKNCWPIRFQEVIHFDSTTGEKHIADVKNGNDFVIEFQNSPIDCTELVSRELFYKNLVWVVNAEKFKSNIQFCSKLPNPDDPKSKDMVIYMPQNLSTT
jgi:competence protein CoiA